ncbi:MAG: hypothetical protein LAO78_03640 [Acidobacteriia bacterium]|nr:hypothetical protein [Terriglobia bacterium]
MSTILISCWRSSFARHGIRLLDLEGMIFLAAHSTATLAMMQLITEKNSAIEISSHQEFFLCESLLGAPEPVQSVKTRKLWLHSLLNTILFHILFH